MHGRYGEVIMEDLAKMSLSDPSNPEELRLGKVAPVTFDSVARKEHKWQVSKCTDLLSACIYSDTCIVRCPRVFSGVV